MSNLIGGGSLNTMQTTVANMNSAFPPPEELDRIHRALAGVIHDLSSNQDTLNKILTNMQTVSESFRANKGRTCGCSPRAPPSCRHWPKLY